MKYDQIELNLGIASNSDNPHYSRSPQYDPSWNELNEVKESTCKSVGEQVLENTSKSIHQHIFTHFVERYWVERRSVKYWYYRYTWVSTGKLIRKYIGSVNSLGKCQCSRMVKEMIDVGFSPIEITKAIDQFSTSFQTR